MCHEIHQKDSHQNQTEMTTRMKSVGEERERERVVMLRDVHERIFLVQQGAGDQKCQPGSLWPSIRHLHYDEHH